MEKTPLHPPRQRRVRLSECEGGGEETDATEVARQRLEAELVWGVGEDCRRLLGLFRFCSEDVDNLMGVVCLSRLALCFAISGWVWNSTLGDRVQYGSNGVLNVNASFGASCSSHRMPGHTTLPSLKMTCRDLGHTQLLPTSIETAAFARCA